MDSHNVRYLKEEHFNTPFTISSNANETRHSSGYPDFKTALAMPLKKQLVLGKWFTMRLPFALQYHTALIQKAPLEKQLRLLPSPVQPRVYWTELKNIKLHGSLNYPPSGRLCQYGDWDLNMIYPLPSVFESIPEHAKKWDLHETVRSIFLYGQHYSTTPQYKFMIKAVEQKMPNPPQGCRTVEEVNNYFRSLIAAFKSMKSNGYLTQEALGKPSVGEIRLHITRNGQLCLGTGGNHRIRLAEILGIRWIPFLLRGVHPEWISQLCRQTGLQPHKAFNAWANTQFQIKRPSDQ